MRKVYELNTGWQFLKAEAEKEVLNLDSEQTVNLPHTWNTGDNFTKGEYLYQRNLTISDEHKEDALYLEFLGANSVCKVYLNQHFVGEHRGGYSTFRFNITPFYKWEEENKLEVFVDNSQTDDVSPLNGDFTVYGGLYRPVNLICLDEQHFSLDYWGTDGLIVQSEVTENKSGIITLDIHTNCDADAIVNIEVLDAENEVIYSERISATQKKVKIEIEKPNLWNGRQNPYLYTIRTSLEKFGKVVDQVTKSFGFRSCVLTSDEGFFLNGEHLWINGVAQHQDFEGVGNAIDERHITQNFDLIDEIGANAIRLSHYQHDQLVYDACDREGYVVWAEIPMMSMPERSSVLENAENQLTELILQNCHHPSICFWGIQNEIAMDGESIAMYQSVETLNDKAHELLPSALTTSANMYHVKNSSQLNFITDMVGYNLYFGWYYDKMHDLDGWIESFHKENPQVPLGISEYGADSNLSFHSNDPKVNDYTEEFQAIYHEETYSIIKSKKYMWGSFLWNMFDFGSSVRNEGGVKGRNNKGLVTFDRSTKKDAFYYYKANWSAEPFVHLCGKRFVNRAKNKMDVKVYSNLKNIYLEVNGTEVQKLEGESVFLFKDVPLRTGSNEVRVYSGKYEDSSVFEKVEKPDTSYVFIDSNPEINVRNWFTQEEGEIDLFPENRFSILDKLGTLMENEEAWKLVEEFSPEIVARSVPGAPVTLLWVVNKMKNVFKEKDIKELNEKLIQINKSHE